MAACAVQRGPTLEPPRGEEKCRQCESAGHRDGCATADCPTVRVSYAPGLIKPLNRGMFIRRSLTAAFCRRVADPTADRHRLGRFWLIPTQHRTDGISHITFVDGLSVGAIIQRSHVDNLS